MIHLKLNIQNVVNKEIDKINILLLVMTQVAQDRLKMKQNYLWPTSGRFRLNFSALFNHLYYILTEVPS